MKTFSRGYKFEGKKGEIIKQIGNSVPVMTAQALCATALRAAA